MVTLYETNDLAWRGDGLGAFLTEFGSGCHEVPSPLIWYPVTAAVRYWPHSRQHTLTLCYGRGHTWTGTMSPHVARNCIQILQGVRVRPWPSPGEPAPKEQSAPRTINVG